MNNTLVSVSQSKESDSARWRWFIMTAKTLGLALLRTSLNEPLSMLFVYFLSLTLAATFAFILWDRHLSALVTEMPCKSAYVN